MVFGQREHFDAETLRRREFQAHEKQNLANINIRLSGLARIVRGSFRATKEAKARE